jgi:hypothetical protein
MIQRRLCELAVRVPDLINRVSSQTHIRIVSPDPHQTRSHASISSALRAHRRLRPTGGVYLAKGSVEGRVKRMLRRVTSGLTRQRLCLDQIIGKCRTILNEGILGQWPVLVEDREGEWRTAWSMRQLLGVLEPVLDDQEGRSHAQRQ